MSFQSPWTNKRAIKQDLSFAQSRRVPGDVKFTTGDLPPVPAVPQVTETEDEYFGLISRYAATESKDSNNKPDFTLIKQMLNEYNQMHELAAASNFESGDSEAIQITKLDPNVPEFVPKNYAMGEMASQSISEKENENLKPKPPVKKVKQRNIAVASILKAIAAENATKAHNGNKADNTQVKLLKPADFVLTEHRGITQSVEKVEEWLNDQENLATPVPETGKKEANGLVKKHRSPMQIDNKEPILKIDTKRLLTLDPTAMFKKKKSVTVSETPAVIESVTSPPPPSVMKNYVPSTKAVEDYQKYRERNRLMTIVQEDIWTKTAREMKEIDDRKKREQEFLALQAEMVRTETPDNELTDSEVAGSSTLTEEQKLDLVRLPMHRHMLPEDCVVCKVLCNRLVRNMMEDQGSKPMTACASDD